MQVSIRGRNYDVSDSLRNAAEEKLQRLARHLDGWSDAEVHFSEERNPRIAEKEVCEITLRGHGHVVRAKAASPDAFSAVDRAIDKVEHQVGKLKRKQMKRPHNRDLAVAGLRADADEDDPEDGGRRIIRTHGFSGKPMTPEEAVLQLDALGRQFVFFCNAETGAAAVVYRRHDGHIGLLDAG